MLGILTMSLPGAKQNGFAGVQSALWFLSQKRPL
jgi:hypothetical protein